MWWSLSACVGPNCFSFCCKRKRKEDKAEASDFENLKLNRLTLTWEHESCLTRDDVPKLPSGCEGYLSLTGEAKTKKIAAKSLSTSTCNF